jgi:glutathione S-transferase
MADDEPVKATAGSRPDVVLFGFERSTYVNAARLVLLAKGVAFAFHDTETEMYTREHQKRHPFGRVPVLRHRDFWLYETAAIALYVDERFPGPALQPADPEARARGYQWISSLNAYFYPYMVYYLVHERVVFPALGIEPDEALVAEALPKIEHALAVLNDELGKTSYVVGDVPSLADYFLLPSLTALGFTPEGMTLLPRFPDVQRWMARMNELPAVLELLRRLPAFEPIEHARHWVKDHRPVPRTRAGAR